MKKLILASAMALSAVVAYGQGAITFANATSSYGSATPDRLIRWDATAANFNPALVAGGLVSSNYGGVNLTGLRAQLYYGASTISSLDGLTAMASAAAPFRASTSVNAGSWLGGARTFTGFDIGATVNCAVVVWDSSLSADPLSAAAKGGLWGSSSVFAYTVPAAGSPPLQYLPASMGAFTVGATVPEPTTLALVGLGAAALMVIRRRK